MVSNIQFFSITFNINDKISNNQCSANMLHQDCVSVFVSDLVYSGLATWANNPTTVIRSVFNCCKILIGAWKHVTSPFSNQKTLSSWFPSLNVRSCLIKYVYRAFKRWVWILVKVSRYLFSNSYSYPSHSYKEKCYVLSCIKQSVLWQTDFQ